ncbi:GNAT family N-acetyltransferase [Actinoplanes sp. G11-F43]|uniref:GNAT family N-acetyltransferase n=1 Tax=Actinoplanes sp. G11-F43 TaxID=3424130 RepID=UPI003D352CA9
MLIEFRTSLDPELGVLATAAQRELADAGLRAGSRIFEPHDDAEHLVGVVHGRAVACATWRPLGPGEAEVRRIYVRPAFRGRGLARQLIVAVEEEALAVDRPVLRLELESGQPAAIALFQSSGYRPVRSAAPDRVTFVKQLPALVQ